MNPLRRLVISSAALAPLGCATATFDRGIPVAAPKKIPSVRSPQLGQEWIYSQFDTFSSRLLDVVTERIEIVGPGVTISRSNRDGANLASEIQSSWGMITTDPHWGRILNYGPAIPLWPEQMQANWSKQFTTRYSIAGYSGNSFGWQQYMYCAGWEKLKVPAIRWIAFVTRSFGLPQKLDVGLRASLLAPIKFRVKLVRYYSRTAPRGNCVPGSNADVV
ncbi:MAG: hypothetical protein EBX16_00645 [Burkholderiaceae bacterium]|nr:hypothetical protein [Burkholderiaceae bacterium]